MEKTENHVFLGFFFGVVGFFCSFSTIHKGPGTAKIARVHLFSMTTTANVFFGNLPFLKQGYTLVAARIMGKMFGCAPS